MMSLLRIMTRVPLRRLIPALLITGFLVSLLALFVLYRLDYQQDLQERKVTDAKKTAILLRDVIESGGVNLHAGSARIVDILSEDDEGKVILVVDREKRVLLSTRDSFRSRTAQSALQVYHFQQDDRLESFIENGITLSRTLLIPQGDRILFVLPFKTRAPIPSLDTSRQPAGYIMVFLDSGNSMAKLDRKTRILILPSLAVIGLPLLFFMALYSRLYATRLQVLMDTTHALKRGELDARAHLFGNDEIAELGKLYNEMATQIGALAYRDSLTGIRNRASFEAAVTFQLKQNQPAAMVFMDLDGFKYVNETFGHNIGDLMLKLVSERITSMVPPEGVFARIGGDEFALFVQDYRDITALQILCDRIIHYVSQDYNIEGIHHHIGISMGIALFPEDGSTFHEILMNSDLAMYQAKHSGKNKFTMFNDDIRDLMRRKTTLLNHLHHIFRKGLVEDKFFTVYQPIIDVETGLLSHVESLIRWTDEDGLRATTSEIIPLLEESGLVRELGYFVFDRVSADFRHILDSLDPDVPRPGITINVSIIQLLDPNFSRRVMDIIRKNGLKPDRLIIEITESELMQHPDRVIRIMAGLHDNGFRFAIDDFGTGYSSLSYLKHLPVSYLKIDRSFIKDVSFDEKSQLIARSIIVLGKALGLKLVAEGVEDLDTARIISRLGTDYLQGFFCSRPLPFVEIQALIRDKFRFYNPQAQALPPA